ncbi:pyridoxal phosphate-dependent aminotransferase [Bosea vestrisii]|uniref:pyridoxal phosphate-dependent aminotransferase n=1 Tax=Bosea vestrisii TaxID=151416 RepID=UPI0024DF31F7|nr:pyridoxal phosphate-dependent aminotransferase [Bosea vestrisii]WID95210.1 pyridoxal phosphate-dependent aminotransferase [Bosea vestrisii]
MSVVAPRMAVIKPSPSMAVTATAARLKAEGVDVISLGAGEPDFPTPDHVVEAAVEAMRRGETRYTAVNGTPALKEAVIRKFRRENELEFEPKEIIVSAGAKQIIYNAMMASLAPGDEVIVPAPYWVSYTDIVLLGEGTPVVVQCDESTGFKLSPESLRKALSSRTKWLFLNSPSNPTGAIYSRDELAALGAVLERFPAVHILTDDIYEHIRFDGRPFHTIAQACPFLKPRVLTINGVSKAYAMTGWRIGYAAGPRELIKAMGTVQGQSTTNACSISQAAAAAALDGPQDFLAERTKAFELRRDRVLSELAGIDGLRCETPEGAFYVYPSCRGLLGKIRPNGRTLDTDDDVALFLLEEARVAVVQGSAYGGSPHFRMSIATSMNNLIEATQRIGEATAGLR